MPERLTGTPIIVVTDFKDIRTMSEKLMNDLGWYRK